MIKIILAALLLSGCCTCPPDEQDRIRKQDAKISYIKDKQDSLKKEVDNVKYGPYSPFNMDDKK